MTENEFENLVVNLFDDHAKAVGDHWVNEVALDQHAVHDFARDLRAVLAAANGPLKATTSKPLPVIPWSGSNLTEMEELLQKVQQLETENAEQCVLLGKGGERECALLGKVERLERELAALREDNLKAHQMACAAGLERDRLRDELAASREAFAKADVLAEHSRFDGRREWTVVETWVYPNDIIVQMDRAAFNAARNEAKP